MNYDKIYYYIYISRLVEDFEVCLLVYVQTTESCVGHF